MFMIPSTTRRCESGSAANSVEILCGAVRLRILWCLLIVAGFSGCSPMSRSTLVSDVRNNPFMDDYGNYGTAGVSDHDPLTVDQVTGSGESTRQDPGIQRLMESASEILNEDIHPVSSSEFVPAESNPFEFDYEDDSLDDALIPADIPEHDTWTTTRRLIEAGLDTAAADSGDGLQPSNAPHASADDHSGWRRVNTDRPAAGD